jgi:peptidoglycan/xylan/chitin deacetylase (PgdA/CDA1 family)
MSMLNPRQVAKTIIDTTGNLVLSPPYGGFGFYHNHGPRNQRKIALTFDDGPSKPSTINLLDAMDEMNVKGTFFCVGMHVRFHPDVLKRLDAAGHVIGNHSMLHARKDGLLLNSGPHIDDSANEIAAVIGRRPRLYRPPWGWLTPWEGQRLTQRGYAVIGWDVYTLDWQVPEVHGDQIAAGIRRDVRPGSIILLHDSGAVVPECHKTNTVHTVRQIVPQLRAQGYEFVTIPELLGLPAYGPIE